MSNKMNLNGCRLIIKGGGEMASGIAVRLYKAGLRAILILEVPAPSAVRRTVSFCEAVYDGEQQVEGIRARRAQNREEIAALWRQGIIAVAVDPDWELLGQIQPHVCVDAILAKRNMGTTLTDAPFTLGIGPGFTAGVDTHAVIETNRGHNLGRVYTEGAAQANTGIPGNICGYTVERVLRAPEEGITQTHRQIGELVRAGDVALSVGGAPVAALLDGVVRGLIRSGVAVTKGTKVGDIDPRGNAEYCYTVSEKARALGGAVLEAICAYITNQGYNGPCPIGETLDISHSLRHKAFLIFGGS
jgi:xanthine dehydrogenase accessory factor